MELADKMKRIAKQSKHNDKVKELAREFATACGWPINEVREMYAYWKDDESGCLECWRLLIAEHQGNAVGINDRIRASLKEAA